MTMAEKRPLSKDSVISSERCSKEFPRSSLKRMTSKPTPKPNLKSTTSWMRLQPRSSPSKMDSRKDLTTFRMVSSSTRRNKETTSQESKEIKETKETKETKENQEPKEVANPTTITRTPKRAAEEHTTTRPTRTRNTRSRNDQYSDSLCYQKLIK